MKRNKRGLLTLPSVCWLLVFTVLPLLIMLYYSVQADDGTGFTWANYLRFFSKDTYLRLTWRTIVMAVLVTVVSLLIAYPLAYILAKTAGSTGDHSCADYYSVFYQPASACV